MYDEAIREVMILIKDHHLIPRVAINKTADRYHISASTLAKAMSERKNKKKYNNPNQLKLF